MNLDQFKKDARTLYNRGYINQKACCDILGLKDPMGPFLKIVVKGASWVSRKLVIATEPKE